jgi:hypothetical protein
MAQSAPQADPNSAVFQVQAFRALKAGGRVHIEIVQGSSKYQDPYAEMQRILALVKAGIFQMPPGVADALLKAIKFTGVDEVIPVLEQAQKDALAVQILTQPDPNAAEQTKQTAQQQQLNMKLQHEKDIESVREQHEMSKLQIEQQADMMKQQAQQQQALAVQQAKNHAELMSLLVEKLHVDIKPTVTLSPRAGESLAAGVGLTPATEQEIDKAMETWENPKQGMMQGNSEGGSKPQGEGNQNG